MWLLALIMGWPHLQGFLMKNVWLHFAGRKSGDSNEVSVSQGSTMVIRFIWLWNPLRVSAKMKNNNHEIDQSQHWEINYLYTLQGIPLRQGSYWPVFSVCFVSHCTSYHSMMSWSKSYYVLQICYQRLHYLSDDSFSRTWYITDKKNKTKNDTFFISLLLMHKLFNKWLIVVIVLWGAPSE